MIRHVGIQLFFVVKGRDGADGTIWIRAKSGRPVPEDSEFRLQKSSESFTDGGSEIDRGMRGLMGFEVRDV
jgi:hypothetical protein